MSSTVNTSSSTSHQNYSTIVREEQKKKERRQFVSTTNTQRDSPTNVEYGFSTSSRFRPIDRDATGAQAIHVQDIPDGVLGRPVEFESEFNY